MFRLFRAIFSLNLGGCVYIYIFQCHKRRVQPELRMVYIYIQQSVKDEFSLKMALKNRNM